jgi:hypothetical protein
MRVVSTGLLLAILALVGCSSESNFATGRLGTGHVVVEGRLTQLPSDNPVSGALVLVGIREINCSSPAAPFQLTTGTDGTFGNRLELQAIPGERACITFDVMSPGSANLQRAVVTIENVRVVRSTSPPDTVRVTISLLPN